MGDRVADASVIASSLERLLCDRPILGLVSIYVFGSHGEGRVHRESDDQ